MSIKAITRVLVLGIVVGLCITARAHEEGEPVVWSLAAPEVKQPVRVGETFRVKLALNLAPGWHVYSITQDPGGPVATVISLPEGQPFRLGGRIQTPTPKKAFDPNFNIPTEFYEESVEFGIPVTVENSGKKGKYTLHVSVYFQSCNDRMCQPPKAEILTAEIMLAPPAVTGSKAVVSEGNKTASSPTAVGPIATSRTIAAPEQAKVADDKTLKLAPKTAQRGASSGGSFTAFLWLAAVMGALSLVTPCVFPMVPITVSYFTNHAGMNRRSAIFSALIYAIGIVLTFTALGMLLAAMFGAGGVNQLAANPWVNLLITAIFLAFAYALFGAYFLQVPPGLMNRINSLTGSNQGSSMVGTLLMGFTFTLTSFTCTAPFVGTLLVMTSQGNWRWPLAGMLAFSTVFAMPFFVLALAPQLMSRLPKAGGWMVQVKVVMGFLEIAAAMKFLSNADLVWRWGIFTRQVVLAVWVGIGFLAVLYVLGYFRMAHDSPVESVGAARVTVAIVFLATTIWLIPGLFGRQLGELEPFLPPELSSSTATGSEAKPSADAGWIMNDYEGALAVARHENEPLFVDFTGYTCTNCRWMEANMFPRPEVATEMGKFVRVRLYTDGHGELFQRHQKMQQERFGTVALPYYAILRPDGTAVTTFPGLTRSSDEFLAFLHKGQAD